MIKFLFLAGLFSFSCCASHSINHEKLQSQNTFLNSLLDEIEDQDISSFDQNSQEEIRKYQIDIYSLKKKLQDIQIEKEKNSNESNKEIKKLIEAYNKKLEELKKSYMYISSKLKRYNAHFGDFATESSHKAYCSNALNYDKKKRRIKDIYFAPLDIIEFNPSSNSSMITIPESEG